MGEPINPSAADRASTQSLATRIVESVREDEEMPLGLDVAPVHGAGHHYRRTDVEALAFTLAQEVTLLRAERDMASVCRNQARATEREVLVLRHLVKRIDETLRVPAAEYVPAISDVFALIDALTKDIRHRPRNPQRGGGGVDV